MASLRQVVEAGGPDDEHRATGTRSIATNGHRRSLGRIPRDQRSQVLPLLETMPDDHQRPADRPRWCAAAVVADEAGLEATFVRAVHAAGPHSAESPECEQPRAG